MKVKNLLAFPVRLDDGKMIGGAGTSSDTRKYGKRELTERDQKRFEGGKLEVINDLPANPEQTETSKSDGGKSKQSGGKQ